MKAVFLDADTLGSDVDLGPMQAAADLTLHGTSAPEQVAERIADAEAVVTNKVVLRDEHFAAAPDLRVVVVTATGVNNIDLEAAGPGASVWSTPSVTPGPYWSSIRSP